MASVRLPAFCPRCGLIFPSSIAIGGGSGTVRFNVETCPRCGGMAHIASATFKTVAGEVLAVIQAPGVSRPMLIAFRAAVEKALQENKPPAELAQEVEMINPAFGPLVRKSATGAPNWLVILAMILSILSISLRLDVKLDLNQLFDQWVQWMNAPPRAVIVPPEPPAPEPEAPSPDRPGMEPREDQPPP